ncbi:hypothetical protein LCGC14_0809660 [marine sediment metagenome]|uniref:DNA primase/polymerase bifunctional N-terminal domain-containing protein n=1 Tax=marine sediment metagenome TaxID=412755 RepID=A0A0F9SUN3_9ZZZZ
MLEVALQYLEYGFSVLPVHTLIRDTWTCTCGNDECPSPGKHPRVPWVEWTKKRADRAQLEEWFEDEALESNIGLVTGDISGVIVVDLDGPAGRESFGDLGLTTHTLIARTGGRGLHLFYRCATPIRGRIAMLPGVDLKAERGFVVLAPSLHASGNRYKWIRRRHPAEIEPGLVQLAETERGNDTGWRDEALVGVGEGERSNTAAQLAGRYVRLGLSPLETYMLLTSWNKRNSPPLTQNELKSTVRWCYQRHNDSPEEEIVNYGDLAGILKRIGEGR